MYMCVSASVCVYARPCGCLLYAFCVNNKIVGKTPKRWTWWQPRESRLDYSKEGKELYKINKEAKALIERLSLRRLLCFLCIIDDFPPPSIPPNFFFWISIFQHTWIQSTHFSILSVCPFLSFFNSFFLSNRFFKRVNIVHSHGWP